MLVQRERMVSVWMGRMRRRDALSDYLERRPGDPMSDFAGDLGVDEYESICETKLQASDDAELQELLRDEPCAESFAPAMLEAAGRLRLWRANAYVLLYDHAFEGDWPPGAPLRFVGTFPYEGVLPRRGASDHRARVEAIAVTRDGRFAVSGARIGGVRVWDVATGALVHAYERGHRDWVQAVAIAAGDRRAVSVANEIILWDVGQGNSKRIGDHGGYQIGGLSLHPTRPLAATACVDRTVAVWDLDAGERVASFDGHAHRALEVAWLDDDRLVSADDAGVHHAWSLGQRRCLWSAPMLPGENGPHTMVVANGRGLTSTWGGRKVALWDEGGRLVRPIPGGPAIAAHGGRAVVGAKDGSVHFWDIESAELVHRSVAHRGEVTAVAVSARASASGSGDGSVVLWDLAGGEVARFCESTGTAEAWAIRSVAIHPTAEVVVAGEASGRVLILERRGAALVPRGRA